MSSDQSPGKVRVFSSGANGGTPMRRRGDRPETGEERALPTPAAISGRRSVFPWLAASFLLGCALGGVAFAWLGLMPGSRP